MSSAPPTIEAAEAAFEAGNHARARKLAEQVRQSDTGHTAQAEALLARLSPAPLGKYLLVLTLLLLISVTIFAYSQ